MGCALFQFLESSAWWLRVDSLSFLSCGPVKARRESIQLLVYTSRYVLNDEEDALRVARAIYAMFTLPCRATLASPCLSANRIGHKNAATILLLPAVRSNLLAVRAPLGVYSTLFEGRNGFVSRISISAYRFPRSLASRVPHVLPAKYDHSIVLAHNGVSPTPAMSVRPTGTVGSFAVSKASEVVSSRHHRIPILGCVSTSAAGALIGRSSAAQSLAPRETHPNTPRLRWIGRRKSPTYTLRV